MKVDIGVHVDRSLILVWFLIIVVVHLLKMLMTIGICWHCNMPKIDGLCLALMLSCKGVVDFCTNVFLHDAMVISLTNIPFIICIHACMNDMKQSYLFVE
jgi:hypothetical protein